ncbi:MAG TPA: hypothetical protein VNX88_16880 [Terriglobales bacterium]|jgi:hypothetical protein|nr:hypothetical protein [Terriglobales bacterium]
MRTMLWVAPAILSMSLFTSGQDWQHCQSDAGSFQQLKTSVHSVTTMHGYSGWDEKAFSRFGDMTSVALLQSLSYDEMTAPQTLRDVLLIIRLAFDCPAGCAVIADDRKPKVTLLLLDQLHNRTRGPSQSAVDEMKNFVIQHVHSTE